MSLVCHQTGHLDLRTMGDASTSAAISRLKQEMDSLRQQQRDALDQATFVGMTSDEAIDFDERSDKVLRLLQQVSILQEQP